MLVGTLFGLFLHNFKLFLLTLMLSRAQSAAVQYGGAAAG
jgi:hypothetical protein